MNPETYRIEEVSSEDEARAKGLVPIPVEDLQRLRGASPEARRQWVRGVLAREAVSSAMSAATGRAFNAGGPGAKTSRKRARKAARGAR